MTCSVLPRPDGGALSRANSTATSTASSPCLVTSASTCAITLSPPSWGSKPLRMRCNGSGRSAKGAPLRSAPGLRSDRKSTRLNSSHSQISYARFCLQKTVRVLGGEIRPAPERPALGGQKHGHGPSALPRHRLHCRHVQGVKIRPLLFFHLEGHNPLLHLPPDCRFFE